MHASQSSLVHHCSTLCYKLSPWPAQYTIYQPKTKTKTISIQLHASTVLFLFDFDLWDPYPCFCFKGSPVDTDRSDRILTLQLIPTDFLGMSKSLTIIREGADQTRHYVDWFPLSLAGPQPQPQPQPVLCLFFQWRTLLLP